MLRGSRTHATESIGARRSQRPSKCLNDLREHGMRADSNRDCVPTSGHNVRNNFTLRQNDGERPWPKPISQLSNQLPLVVGDRSHAIKPVVTGQVNNERVEMRSLFRFKNLRNSDRVQSVGGEAVNSFRWQGDWFTLLQEFCRAVCSGGWRLPTTIMDRRYNFCFHLG